MTEIVKVFKNTGGTPIVPADMDAVVDYTLHTTSSSENVVIKDVHFKVGGTTSGIARINPVLTLNGTPVRSATGGSLEVDSNIIMGPSSTLKVTFDPTSGGTVESDYFKGMFFTESSTGVQMLKSDGTSTTMSSVAKLNANNFSTDDACAAKVGNEIRYFRTYSNTIYEYNEAAATANTPLSSWSYGSTGYSITTDGTYLYRGHGSSGSTPIFRTKISDRSTTTLQTTANYGGPTSNQGAGFHYYKDPTTGTGYIFSKYNGPASTFFRINLTTLGVTTYSNGDYSTGSYSDGGFVTTTLAGVPYVVEIGDTSWWYHNINTGVVVKRTEDSQTSTEYAQGGTEIAPGIGLIFGEQSDRATIIDMNPATPTFVTYTSSHGYTTDYAYGNRFGFAGYLSTTWEPPKDYEYSAYVSGIEIT
jgi:hypothetical protein